MSNQQDYIDAGYNDRADYLEGLADEHGCPLDHVLAIANLFGSTEDFDGLVTTLENQADAGTFW